MRFACQTSWILCWSLLLLPNAVRGDDLDSAAIDRAFAALQAFDWGSDRSAIDLLDRIVLSSEDDVALRKKLEARLIEVVAGDGSQAAKGIACHQLSFVGTAASVPALAPLLKDPKLSHRARYALQRIPAPEAARAIREVAAKSEGALKIGMINSLGERGDAESLPLLSELLTNQDTGIAAAAAAATGKIGTAEASKSLLAALDTAGGKARLAIADACLVCAARLMADDQHAEAVALYRKLAAAKVPQHVKLAATRGMLEAIQ